MPLAALHLALKPAEVVGDEDGSPVGWHGVRLRQEVLKDKAVDRELRAEFLLEGTEVSHAGKAACHCLVHTDEEAASI
jgi:hypothetical protein